MNNKLGFKKWISFILIGFVGQIAWAIENNYLNLYAFDCTKDYVYIFEFKRDSSADEALGQIEDMQYALPYAADARTLYKIGVNFDSDTRMLTEWKMA